MLGCVLLGFARARAHYSYVSGGTCAVRLPSSNAWCPARTLLDTTRTPHPATTASGSAANMVAGFGDEPTTASNHTAHWAVAATRATLRVLDTVGVMHVG